MIEETTGIGILDMAIRFAVMAHAGQRCKVGRPAILHPLRVMDAVRDCGEDAMAAAVLHDVIEDTEVVLDDLRSIGMPYAVIRAVDLCTRLPDGAQDRPTYRDFILRIRESGDPIAIAVKFADINDNLGRLHEQPPDAQGIARRYHAALAVLAGS